MLSKEYYEKEISAANVRISQLENELRNARAQVTATLEQITWLQQRLEEALAFERENSRGLQYRVGILRPESGKDGDKKSPEPVRTARAPWDVTRRGLERHSVELAQKDNDQRAAHWTKKIKEVEEADKAKADDGDIP